MKDLIVKNQSGTINATFRTDLIDASANDFTIMTITGLSEQDTTNTYKEKKLINAFKKLQTTLQTFVAFCKLNELQLTLQNGDGSNPQILARMYDESSYSESNSHA